MSLMIFQFTTTVESSSSCSPWITIGISFHIQKTICHCADWYHDCYCAGRCQNLFFADVRDEMVTVVMDHRTARSQLCSVAFFDDANFQGDTTAINFTMVCQLSAATLTRSSANQCSEHSVEKWEVENLSPNDGKTIKKSRCGSCVTRSWYSK